MNHTPSTLVETDAPLAELDGLAATRAGFLRRAAIFGGTTLAATSGLLAVAGPAAAAGSKKGDVAILNYALTLEYLESQFYAIGAEKAPLRGPAKRLARVIRDHELAHVDAIKATIPKLGGKAVAKPKFDFGGAFSSEANFMATAMALEDTGVSAYNGAGPMVNQMAVKQAAASIVAVEAMHAAWVRAWVGEVPAPAGFDQALSKREVLAIAGPFLA